MSRNKQSFVLICAGSLERILFNGHWQFEFQSPLLPGVQSQQKQDIINQLLSGNILEISFRSDIFSSS